MANSINNDDFLINLKELASQNNLNLTELKSIITFCGNFFSQDLPQQFDKSFNLPFLIQGFGGKTFKLLKSNKIETQQQLIAEISQDQNLDSTQKEKIIVELKKQQDLILQNNIFLSDLLAFLEQSSIQLTKFLNQNNKQALAKLGSDFFSRIGLAPKAASKQLLIKELEKLEQNPSIWQRINSDLVRTMLSIIEDEENNIIQANKQVKNKDDISGVGAFSSKQIIKENQDIKQNQGEEDAEQNSKYTLPESFSKEFNLAKLDDLSKLYIRSLAIISVNQTLQIQFANLTKKQLLDMGFDQIPNFNQLSLENREQLLIIAFNKIENLLASGRYDLENLISTPSFRIIFAKEVALKILTDIRGGEIFAREIGELTKSDSDPTQIKERLLKNENQNLSQKKLDAKFVVRSSEIPEELRAQLSNLSDQEAKKIILQSTEVSEEFKTQLSNLSSQEAENFFAKLDSDNNLKNNFSTNLKKSFNRVTKNNFLSEWKAIVVNDKNAIDRSFLAQENILPIIDVFIQQNYPVAYLEYFDWQRFQAHFGRDIISQNTYLANERVIKDLLTCYWKSQRAEWSKSIHQGIDNEFYSPSDIEQLWTEFNSVGKIQKRDKKIKSSAKSPIIRQTNTPQIPYQINEIEEISFPNNLSKKDKKILQKQTIYFQQLKQQAYFNLIDANAVTKKLAGFSQEEVALYSFNQEQIKNLEKITTVYKQNFLNIINNNGQKTQTVALQYYFPNEEYNSDNVSLQTDTLPQFSPYDLGAINYNQAFNSDEEGQSPLLRTKNEEGGIDNHIQDGFSAVKNTAGQAADFVGEKAVRVGLNYATAGAFETLPEPIKQMIEKVAWSKLKKILEPLIKILIALILAAFAALIALIGVIIKIISFFSIGVGASAGGVNESSPILAKQSIWSKIKEGATDAINSLSPTPATHTSLGSENRLAEQTTGLKKQSISKTQPKPVKPISSTTAAARIGQGVMTTASQAVLTAFGIAAGGTIFYQTVINSAFLTEFPKGGGGGGGGGTVFCDGVAVGSLTYYNQQSMNHISICSPSCQFGMVACGPTSVSMILKEDPETVSIREGYLYCAKTTCMGSYFGDLIATLNSNGVPTTVVPLTQGSPTEITDQISQYLAEGNVILARTNTHGIGHFYIIVCVDSPGTVTTFDPWYGENWVHQVGTDTTITDIAIVRNQ